MRRKAMFFVITVFFCCTMTGCFGNREVNELSIISGMIFDKVSDMPGNQYSLSCELINKNTDSIDESSQPSTLKAFGNSISQVTGEIENMDSRTPYWSHAKVIGISKALVETDGILPIVDFIMRNKEIRFTTLFFLYDSLKVSDPFELQTNSTNIKAFDFSELLETGETKSILNDMDAIDLINILSMNGIEVTLPIIGSSSTTENAEFAGTAIFRDDKYVGFITPEETKIMLILKDKYKTGTLTADGFQLDITKCKATTSSSGDINSPEIHTNLKITARVAESFPQDNIAAVTTHFQDALQKQSNELVRKAQQEFQSDFIGYGAMIDIPSDTDWRSIFPSAKIQITCEITLLQGELRG